MQWHFKINLTMCIKLISGKQNRTIFRSLLTSTHKYIFSFCSAVLHLPGGSVSGCASISIVVMTNEVSDGLVSLAACVIVVGLYILRVVGASRASPGEVGCKDLL